MSARYLWPGPSSCALKSRPGAHVGPLTNRGHGHTRCRSGCDRPRPRCEAGAGGCRRARLWGRIRESRPLRGQRRELLSVSGLSVGSCRLRYSPLTDSSPPSSAQGCAGSSWLVPAGASSARTLCRDRGGWSGGAAQRCTPLHSRLARRSPAGSPARVGSAGPLPAGTVRCFIVRPADERE